MKKRKSYSDTDFLVTDLPSNRKELFFDILKNQWRSIFLICFIVFIAFVPLIINNYLSMSVTTEYIDKTTNAINVEFLSEYFSATVLYNFINILLFAFMGFIFSGLSRILKRMVYNEGFFMGPDFVKGVKENGKEYLILFFLFGVLTWILNLGGIQLSINVNSNIPMFLFDIIRYVFLCPILGVSMAMSAIYTDKISTKIIVSTKLYFKHLPKLLLMLVIMIFPLGVLILFGSPVIQLFYPMLYALIYFSLAYILFLIVCNHIFDKEINIKNFPHLVGKGMYVKES